MTTFERKQKELGDVVNARLLIFLLTACSFLAGSLVLLAIAAAKAFWIWIPILFVASLVAAHYALVNCSKYYQLLLRNESDLRDEIGRIRAKIQAVHDKYPKRRKGERFKDAYELVGTSIPEFEQRLGVGMYAEVKEVFVMAFCKAGRVVRVTAAIGSAFQCSPADNPSKWNGHIARLGCDELRQYHNHPVHTGHTKPSPPDYRGTVVFKNYLGINRNLLRSFIVYWNTAAEWKILQYDENPTQTKVVFEFDVELAELSPAVNSEQRH